MSYENLVLDCSARMLAQRSSERLSVPSTCLCTTDSRPIPGTDLCSTTPPARFIALCWATEWQSVSSANTN
jgi:hypothetical protein